MELRVSSIKQNQKPNKEQYFKIVKNLKSEQAFKNLSLQQLAYYIGEGQSVILANYNKTNESIESISRKHIKDIQLLTLDIETDSKSKLDPMPIEEMIKLIESKYDIKPIITYNTFSHTEEDPRARLIYYMNKPISADDYEKVLTIMLKDIDLMGRVDSQCKNANRIWQGTNKKVATNRDYKPVKDELVQALLNAYEESKNIYGDYNKVEYEGRKGIITDLSEKVRIKTEYRGEIKQMANKTINIVEFLQKHFDLKLPNHCRITDNIINCYCPIHGGTNEKGFAIFQNTNSAYCYGDCDRYYDILQLAYLYYGEFNLNKVALTLIEEYNLPLDERWIEYII